MYPTSSKNLNIENEKEIRFFTTAFHVFDNFSAHAVELWGHVFMTSEHAFQWKKFSFSGVDSVAEEIKMARSPEKAKAISKKNESLVSENWHNEKVQVMEEILRAKVLQHDDVKGKLLETGDRLIIENSPEDSFWGIGSNNDGQNKVGNILMKIRSELK